MFDWACFDGKEFDTYILHNFGKDRTFSHHKNTTLKIKLKIAFFNLRYGRQPGGV